MGGAGAPWAETETRRPGGVRSAGRCTARFSSGGSSAGASSASGPTTDRDRGRGDRRDRPRAAAAVHQARRHAQPIASAIRPCLRARAARLPRRPRACTSRRACSQRSRARGVESRDDHAARRIRHVSAGPRRPGRGPPARAGALRDRRRRRPRAINRALDEGRRVIAVGTTTTRTLEAVGAAPTAAAIVPARGATDLFIYPGLRLPGHQRPADELSPAAVVAADAGVRRLPAASACWPPIARRSRAGIGSTATATRC